MTSLEQNVLLCTSPQSLIVMRLGVSYLEIFVSVSFGLHPKMVEIKINLANNFSKLQGGQ